MSIKALLDQKRKEGSFSGQDLYLILSAIKDTAEKNPDVQEILKDLMEEGIEVRVNITLPDTNRKASISLEQGKVVFAKALVGNPTLSITFPESLGIQILLGKETFQCAYKTGRLKLEGNLSKAAALAMVLNICADEYNVY